MTAALRWPHKAAQEEFLASVGTPPRINLPIFYGDDGSISIGDLSIDELSAMTGVLRLMRSCDGAGATLHAVRGMGVSVLGISTDKDGITISLDGKALPTLDWSDGKASNLIEMASQIPLLEIMGFGSVLPMVNQLLPLVQSAEIDLTLHF